MARMTVLASGSKGNSTIVASSQTRILVDAGLSCRELLKRMQAAGEDPAAIDAVLITHEHQDHVQGLAVLARRLGVPVYFTEATHRAWMRWMKPSKKTTYQEWLARRREDLARGEQSEEASFASGAGEAEAIRQQVAPDGRDPQSSSVPAPDRERASQFDTSGPQRHSPAQTPQDGGGACALPGVEYFAAGRPFSIGDIAVTPFTIPHDAVDPVGFVFELEGVRMAMATDLGYMPSNVEVAVRKCEVLLLESNHDLEMLRDGPYPWPVKQRVMSRVGHLSNDAAADFLEKSYDGNASYIVLAHLSESNNLPELAKVSAERVLRERMGLEATEVILAEQSMPLEPICL